MKTSMLLLAFALAAGCEPSADRTNADNTKKNERDVDSTTKTPGDQAENDADRKVSQEVRKGVMSDESLSVNAKNVKIVTKDGVVTLRGPVENSAERDTIAQVAEKTTGVKRVDNQLEVKTN